MTTEYKLNTLIEWTDEDRAKGECPVPIGSDVTLWFKDGNAARTEEGTSSDWGDCPYYITSYLIHSVPREPIVRWVVVGGLYDGCCYHKEKGAKRAVATYGGRVVKLVEESVMTDGNTYAINKHLDELEDHDALQEVTTELEQAEARIEELKKELKFWRADSVVAWDKCEENRVKLAKARENALREAVDHISHHGSRNDIYSKSRNDAASAILTLIEQKKAPPKGQDDE